MNSNEGARVSPEADYVKVATDMATLSESTAPPPSCKTVVSSANEQTKIKNKQQPRLSTKQAKSEERPAKSRPQNNGQATSPTSLAKSQPSRRAQQKGNNSQHADGKSSASKDPTNSSNRAGCSSLEQFSARAQEIKQDIYDALEKQSQMQMPDEPIEIVKLKNDILKLSGAPHNTDEAISAESPHVSEDISHPSELGTYQCIEGNVISNNEKENNGQAVTSEDKPNEGHPKENSKRVLSAQPPKQQEKPKAMEVNSPKVTGEKKSSSKNNNHPSQSIKIQSEPGLASFEPLSAKLDQETKYISLVSSMKKDFEGSPGVLEPICKKLVQMSELISKLQSDCENYDSENKKLLVIKQKLENLCRELQKSNNAIRIESLDLIKLEQGKAKEQTTKIQSTLSGVIKLFDENQQRNMTLRQENQELQTKLRSLLEHCDNWEKGFAAALRQRDIENRLIKTELAKANLLKNEEKERFLKEKQDLLQLLSMMQEHQSRIEGQEAKLRSDLSNYASKYDECQAVISKGMSKFQTESKRMLKQMEKSKQDYKVLLTKYESSNKRMAQLLDEKQRWDKSMSAANKKIETLEKLCRALRDQKSEPKGNESQLRNNSKSGASEKINKMAKKQQPGNSGEKQNAPAVAEVDIGVSGDANHTSHLEGRQASSLGKEDHMRLDSKEII